MKSFVCIIKKICALLFVATVACIPFALAADTYTVQTGDTLYSISRRFGVEVENLRKTNNIASSNIIYTGQKLTIPSIEKESKEKDSKQEAAKPERTYDVYTVQKGDTFYNIAKVNDITVSQLKALNNLSEESMLKAGQKLKIPISYADSSTANLPDLPSNDPRKYSAKKGDTSLTWPVKASEVVYTQGKVSGVQLSAKKDEAVKSIRAGIVMYTGNYRGYGNVVFVQAKAGYIYAYTGLGSIKVNKGDYVLFNDTLGTAGTDSIKGSSQISLMVFLNSKPIDPAKAPRG